MVYRRRGTTSKSRRFPRDRLTRSSWDLHNQEDEIRWNSTVAGILGVCEWVIAFPAVTDLQHSKAQPLERQIINIQGSQD